MDTYIGRQLLQHLKHAVFSRRTGRIIILKGCTCHWLHTSTWWDSARSCQTVRYSSYSISTRRLSGLCGITSRMGFERVSSAWYFEMALWAIARMGLDLDDIQPSIALNEDMKVLVELRHLEVCALCTVQQHLSPESLSPIRTGRSLWLATKH